MLGGAVNNTFKPLTDEFKRWREVLDEPYKQYRTRYGTESYTDSRPFNL
jgi:protein involved in sex pheromone biosynthesis